MKLHAQSAIAATLVLVFAAACAPDDGEPGRVEQAVVPGCSAGELVTPGGVPASGVGVTASSQVNNGRSAAKAIDGSTSSFWESSGCANQWLRVDLGAARFIQYVTIDWAYNWSTSFDLQISTDGSTWTTARAGLSGSGTGLSQYPDIDVSARYLRLYNRGCSGATVAVDEIEVHGDANPGCGSGGAPTCSDGIKNQDETGVDCGGVCGATCAAGVACAADGDCQTAWCRGGLCAAASCSDGLRNQGEAAADCGGPCAPCAFTTCTASDSGFAPPGYTCFWHDEFGGALGGGQPKSWIDQARFWTFQNLNVNNESQNYTNRECIDPDHSSNWNYCIENGALTLRARKLSLDCTDGNDSDDQPDNPDCALDWSQSRGRASYTSGRLITKHKVVGRYGYLEFRARLPHYNRSTPQSGLWPAIWLLGNNINEGPPPGATAWPACGEVDMMEWKSPSNHMGWNALWIGDDGTLDACSNWPEGGEDECGPCVVSDPNVDICTGVTQNGSRYFWDGWHGFPHTVFHTYGFKWTNQAMEVFIDGKKMSTLHLGESESEFQKDMFVIMNLAVGGDLGGAIQVTDWTTTTLDVDYIRWYQPL